MNSIQMSLGFVGAGNMAEAIARGIVAARLYAPQAMLAADLSGQRRSLFSEKLGIRATEDSSSVAAQCRIVLLCVKPQQMGEVLSNLKRHITPGHLVVSIAAGISTRFIEEALGEGTHVVRAMPNTPMLVGKGMIGICAGRFATADDLQTARAIFSAAGSVAEVEESLMNAVTAVSGSGPAYFFYLVEQMIRAGVELGLSPEVARQLASQTARGAAEMLCTGDELPQELRGKVTSPGGTTHAAISHMEAAGLPQIVVDAVKAAERRGRELGK